MRRSLVAFVILALFIGGAIPSAHAAEEISISPTAGNQSVAFSLRGSGLPIGRPLEIFFISPDGEEFAVTKDGGSSPYAVDVGGKFELQFVPARDLAGSAEGRWQVEVCVVDGDACWETEFEVSA